MHTLESIRKSISQILVCIKPNGSDRQELAISICNKKQAYQLQLRISNATMLNPTRFIILAVTLVMAWGQGGASTLHHSDHDHRHLLEDDAECVLYVRIMDFFDGRPAEYTWYCEFEQDETRSLDVNFMSIEGVPKDVIDSYGTVSGASIMRIKGAYILRSIKHGVSTLVVPDGASFTIEKLMEDDRRHYKQRQQLGDGHRMVGTRRTLVVRVIDNEGNAFASKAKMMDDVFTDAMCLKSQYAACSFNQLMFEPSTEGGGVIDMTVSESRNNPDEIEAKARAEFENLYGPVNEKFDNVIFCLPGPIEGIKARPSATFHGWDSYLHGEDCESVSFLMHEIGHNLGLSHSGYKDDDPAVDDNYNDETGLMGYSYWRDDGPAKCFNAPKNWQLGWYAQQELELDPLSIIGNPQTYVLNGIVDYQPAGSPDGKVVVFRLVEYGDDPEPGNDYYIGFNRASGFNEGTRHARDQVVIWDKELGGPYGIPSLAGDEISVRIKELNVGETYAIPNFKGGIYTVYIEWVSLSGDSKDATIRVLTTVDEVPVTPTPTSPTKASKKTKSPKKSTKAPTKAPTEAPIKSPKKSKSSKKS